MPLAGVLQSVVSRHRTSEPGPVAQTRPWPTRKRRRGKA
jgi:hypothetical protein